MWETMDSEDMTPPVSPRLMDKQTTRPLSTDFDDVEPLCFICCGEVTNSNDRNPTHSFGPLRRGVVSRLTEQRLQPTELNLPTVELFGFVFPRCLVSTHQIDQFFNILKQRILQLEQPVKVSNSESLASALRERQNIRKAFDHLLLTIPCLKKDEVCGLSVATKLVENIRNLLLCVGLLCGKPSFSFSNLSTRAGSKSFTSASHVLHLHIEVWWSCIEVLHAVSVSFHDGLVSSRPLSESRCTEDGSLSDNLDPLSECVKLLLWQFVALAVQQFNAMSLEDIDRTSVFPCACVRELFVILIQFLRYQQFQLAKQSFWLILTSILHQILTDDPLQRKTDQEINSDVFSLPPDQATCQDAIGFCWWMVCNVAPLYQYDQTGCYSSANIPVSDCYGFVQTLMEKSLMSPEVRLRCWLRCVISLVEIWEPNTKLITILWDHFYRKLNDQLLIPESAVANLASISRSASTLLERCQKLTTPDGMNKQENSFFQFLRILHMFLCKSSTGAKVNSEWRQIKGRMFSKFYSRKMQELNETGLHNLSCLFLVLAQTVDLEEASSKLLELYAMLGTAPEDYIRRQAIWKGTLALCLLYVERQRDISFLAEKIVALFNEACKELQQSKLSSGSRGELWRLYQLYLEGVQDVIDTSEHFDLHEEKLIGDGFHQLLMSCRDSELPPILDFLQEIFTKHRIVYKRLLQTSGSTISLKGMSDALWKNAYGYVKQRCSLAASSHHPPPPQLADVAASFTLLAMNFVPSSGCGVGDGFFNCFSYFAWSDQIDVSISCRFLCHMLPNQSVVERMSAELPGFERQVIRSWFRSSWYVDPTSDHMQQLTRHVSKLPLFARVFVRSNGSVPDGEDCSVRFIKAVGRGFDALPMDLQLKAEYRAEALEYFGDVVKYCNLKESASQDEANRIYCLAGRIVKHCARLTYVKSNAYCLFPLLLEKLCLPRAVVMGKELPSYLLPAVKQSLHLFVQGLASLDYRRDPYLQRKLREIISQYLPRFQRVVRTLESLRLDHSCALSLSRFYLMTSQMATVSSVHPLTKSLSSSFGWTVPEDATVFRQHIFDVVRDEFLGEAKSLTSQDSLKALSFILSVLEKMKSSTEVARDARILLPISLDRLLMSGNTSERDLSSQLQVLLLDAAKKLPQSSTVQDCINSVLKTFIGNVSLYQNRVFNVLEPVAAIQPSILTDLIPVMTQAVRNLEFKRGVGIDKQLRLHYFNLLSLLGDSGNSEKTKLMQERE